MAEQDLQSAVESALDAIWGTFSPAPAFLATHFSCGALGSPGYIIKSAARAESCRFADWAGDDEKLHADVIVRHARQFQRSTTVPALLAKLSHESNTAVIMTLRVSDLVVPLLVSREVKEGYTWVSVEFSGALASALCPPNLPEDYLKALYDAARSGRRSESPNDRNLRPFDLPRYAAYGILAASHDVLVTNVAKLLPSGSHNPDEAAWSLLGTLQSALLYFEGSRAVGDSAPISGFACAFPLDKGDKKKGESETPFGFCLGGPLVLIKPESIHLRLNRTLTADAVQKHLHGEDIGKKREVLVDAISMETGMTTADVKAIASAIEADAEYVVPFDGPRKRLLLAGLWMVYLISKLKASKHEGRAVDFWFAAGERTEFADDVDVRLEKHPLSVAKEGGKICSDEEFNCAKFVPANIGHDLKLNVDGCRLIVRRLEKEHYPWFSRGRYCLFFDISEEHLNPCGLAELRSGSWNRLLGESYKLPDEQELNIPGCLVAFVDGASGDAGLLVCQPRKPGGPGPRVKRSVRLRGGRWKLLASDERKQALEDNLAENVPWLLREGDDVKMISQMAIMIADDPHAGGTLVFVDGNPSGSFLRLGAPWEFDLVHQDRIPLISHDGATVVWKQNGEGTDRVMMAYRLLLTPDNSEGMQDIIKTLETQSLGANPDFPLLGVGTRRWSAALCALRKTVKMVVVISTDGDLTCWWGNDSGSKQLWFHHLPIDFSSAKHKKTQVL